MPLMKAYNMSISPIENKVNTMKAKDIIAVLEKRGMKEASADHPDILSTAQRYAL